MESVYKTLTGLGVLNRPVVTAFNKIDVCAEDEFPADATAKMTVGISAKTGEGLDKLLNIIEAELKSTRREIEIVLPYTEGGLISAAHTHPSAEILLEEHTEAGTRLRIIADDDLLGRLEKAANK
jgi:GTP-binding protein HflX